MRAWKENNVDMEALASFEDELLPKPSYNQINHKDYNDLYGLGSRINGFPKKPVSEERRLDSQGYFNPYTSSKIKHAELGSVSSSEAGKELGLIEKVSNWISENPGKAILGALLIGGGSYLLMKYIKGQYLKALEEKKSSKKKKRKLRKKVQEAETAKEGNSDTVEEIAVGMAATAGGILLGVGFEEYAALVAAPVAVLGLVKKKTYIVAAAIGMFLSGGLKKPFMRLFGNGEDKKEKQLEGTGYIKSILGNFNSSELGLSGA